MNSFNPLYCEVCNMSFHSLGSLNDHKLSREHQFKSIQSLNGYRPAPVDATHPPVGATHPPVRESGEYYCALCDVRSNSREQFEIHRRGKLHKKKEKTDVTGSSPSSMIWCKVCNIPVNTMEQLRLHEQGGKHMKASSCASVSSHTSSPMNPVNQGSEYICRVCNVCCNSKDAMDAHLMGRQHIKKDRKTQCKQSWSSSGLLVPATQAVTTAPLKRPGEYEGDNEFECSKCGEVFRSRRLLDEHFPVCEKSVPAILPAKYGVIGGERTTKTLRIPTDDYALPPDDLYDYPIQRESQKAVSQSLEGFQWSNTKPGKDVLGGGNISESYHVSSNLTSTAAPMSTQFSKSANTKADFYQKTVTDTAHFDMAAELHSRDLRGRRYPGLTSALESEEHRMSPFMPSQPSQTMSSTASQPFETLSSMASQSLYTMSSAPSKTPEQEEQQELQAVPAILPPPSAYISSALTPCEHAIRNNVIKKLSDHEFKCTLCNVILNSEGNVEAHLGGKQHIKKADRAKPPDDSTLSQTAGAASMNNLTNEMRLLDLCDAFWRHLVPDVLEIRPDGMITCKPCGLSIHRNNMDSHIKGREHRKNLAKTGNCPTDMNLPPVQKDVWVDTEKLKPMKLKPRKYQSEVFQSAMQSDSIVFLPTGTGKTLVACMVILEMLERNPRRQALFLVDKVLLVLQQADEIKEQIGEADVLRSESEKEPPKRRKLRIASLCGNHVDMSDGGHPLHKQDLIIVTAAYLKNLLEASTLNWSNLCLAVFDEAHHCTKDHPYNKLLKKYHLHPHLHPEQRCKVLGLTASPAGTMSPERTIKRMKTLLEEMGGLRLAAVEKCQEELQKFTSNTKLISQVVEYLPCETQLRLCLVCYLHKLVCGKLFHFSNSAMADVLHSIIEQIFKVDKSLPIDKLDDLRNILNKLNDVAKERNSDQRFKQLLDHAQFVTDLIVSLDSAGWGLALQGLADLLPKSDSQSSVDTMSQWQRQGSSSFAAIAEFDSDCQEWVLALKKMVCAVVKSVNDNTGLNLTSIAQALVEEVNRVQVDGRGGSMLDDTMVLVLAKERSVAWCLSEFLDGHTSLGVKAVVGHGTTSGTSKGMRVNQQRNALKEIEARKYRVIVATAVAEEGVNLPACKLVILLSPPTSMQALVQARGRARLKESRFLILCRNMDEKEQIAALERREKHMIHAAEVICKEQRQQASYR